MGRAPVAGGERQNHLTRSREGREERDVDRLPNHLFASSLRVFAPSRGKKGVREPPINFLNDDRGSFWITPMIQNAPGCILDYPDDSKLHRGAILNHRDDPELHRDDPELIGEDAKPAREDAGTVLDGPQVLRDDPGTDRDDPELVRDDPGRAPDDPRFVLDVPKSLRDAPERCPR